MSAPLPLLARALGLGYAARAGDVDALEVAEVLTAAGELLEGSDPLRRAITTFATTHEVAARDPEAMALAGIQLCRAVQRATWPDPVARHEPREAAHAP